MSIALRIQESQSSILQGFVQKLVLRIINSATVYSCVFITFQIAQI